MVFHLFIFIVFLRLLVTLHIDEVRQLQEFILLVLQFLLNWGKLGQEGFQIDESLVQFESSTFGEAYCVDPEQFIELELDQILQKDEIFCIEIAQSFVVLSLLNFLPDFFNLIAQSFLAIGDSFRQFLALLHFGSTDNILSCTSCQKNRRFA